MDAAERANDDQSALWNSTAGSAWVDLQETLDRMFEPIAALLAEAVLAAPGGRVLDVGCGAGATTLAAASALGARGQCTGVDISEPLIAAARARAGRGGVPARFICADAQIHPFDPSGFDMIVSRFGVMFFDDFAAAFANLRRSAASGAGLRLVVWRSPDENPFMTAGARAAAMLLPDARGYQPDAPGPFALADARRVVDILNASGWTGIDLQPLDVACAFPERDLAPYLARLGPVARVLPEVDEETRKRVMETVRAAYKPFVHGAEVRFTAACWLIVARAA